MSDAFQYRPKFRDIRIKPPKEEAKAEEKRCEWAGCTRKAECRAPKSPNDLKTFYWFCPQHAAHYNKSWDFFSGMSEGEIRAFQASGYYGHRPTWTFKNGRRNDPAAKSARDWTNMFSDPHGFFTDELKDNPVAERRLSRIQKKALEDMGLGYDATKADIRKKYRELVKRLHPDSNGGDRSTEDQLQVVIRAFQTLKTTGLA